MYEVVCRLPILRIIEVSIQSSLIHITSQQMSGALFVLLVCIAQCIAVCHCLKTPAPTTKRPVLSAKNSSSHGRSHGLPLDAWITWIESSAIGGRHTIDSHEIDDVEENAKAVHSSNLSKQTAHSTPQTQPTSTHTPRDSHQSSTTQELKQRDGEVPHTPTAPGVNIQTTPLEEMEEENNNGTDSWRQSNDSLNVSTQYSFPVFNFTLSSVATPANASECVAIGACLKERKVCERCRWWEPFCWAHCGWVGAECVGRFSLCSLFG